MCKKYLQTIKKNMLKKKKRKPVEILLIGLLLLKWINCQIPSIVPIPTLEMDLFLSYLSMYLGANEDPTGQAYSLFKNNRALLLCVS